MQRPTILIVEDDPDIRRILVELLDHRFMVVTAEDGPSALSQARAQQPDLILLDLRLPGLDGLDVLRCIRQNDQRVGVMILSAWHDEDRIVACLDAGADDFLRKPFDLDELEARVDSVLRRCKPVLTAAARDRFGALTVENSRVPTVSGNPLYLSPTEWRCARVFVASPDSLITVEELCQTVYGQYDLTLRHPMQMHIRRLKVKLQQYDDAPRLVNECRQGYRLVARA